MGRVTLGVSVFCLELNLNARNVKLSISVNLIDFNEWKVIVDKR